MNNFIKFWNNIDYDNATHIKNNIKELSTFILQGLLQSKIEEEEISTGLIYRKSIVCSQLTFDQYDDDKTLSLCVNPGGIWSLLFTYWDQDGAQQEIEHLLNKEQLDIIPDGLKNILLTTLKTENPVTIGKGNLDNGNKLS